MNAETLLRALCERHGLPVDEGRRLLPLVRKALEAPTEVRVRILAIVEANLARRAGGARSAEEALLEETPRDREVLVAVARILHDWGPSDPMLELGDRLADFLGHDA